MVGGFRHAQPLDILDARDWQPFAIALGVGVGTPAWYAPQKAVAAAYWMARKQLSFGGLALIGVGEWGIFLLCCI